MTGAPVSGAAGDLDRVSTLELFFDLVFVFTISQVALIVEHHAAWSTVAQAMLELAMIYWLYGGFAWLTNTIGTRTPRQRVVLLLGMAAFLVVSLSVPRAFGADGVAFGWAYLVLAVLHLAGFLIGGVPSAARAMLRIGSVNLTAAALVLVAGYVGAPAHWALWTAALLLVWLSPLPTLTSGSFTLSPAQFGERHGLMIIIVLGESVVSVALAAQELPVTAGLVVGVLCGLAAVAALWWCYFAADDERAVAALERTEPQRRALVALFGYDLTHVLMLAGVIGVAAGARLSLPRLTEPTSVAAAWLIAAGAAVYLLGLAGFRAALRFGDPLPRLATAALVCALVPLGRYGGASWQLVATAAVVAAMLLVERVRERSSGSTPRPAQASDAGR